MTAQFNRRDAKRFSRLTAAILLSSTLLMGTGSVQATGDFAQATKAQTKPGSVTEAKPSSKDVLRLTKEVKPSAYELTFEPDLVNFTYTGKEVVSINVASPRKEIMLHALEMDISEVVLTTANGKAIKAKVEMDPANEQAKLLFDESVPTGTHKLQMNFSAKLNDSLRGFYRSYYKDSAGEKHWTCSSQMEPSDARRMFPCFDEPEFKATFQLNAVIDPKHTAISNAPVEKTTELKDKNKKLVVFEASPKMSTYLMVLVVGEFSSTEMRKANDVPIRVWAPTGQEKMGSYALGAACECMVFLENYFGIKFPAKKLDLIAIPDFAPGAMENLGAITFKDSLLLIDEKTGSNFAKRSALSVIAHEMAHQWFGDLVTMRWWDDLWLNEAFATWAASKTEDSLRPEWRIRAKEMSSRADAMRIDELASTRAIHAHVGNPKQASEMFDAITYDKGSNVLRMLEVFVGEKTFQKGVHDYLEAHKFDNAVSDDLWSSIGAASNGVPVQKMMQTWIMQGGFPLVSEKSGAGKSLTVSQERFLVMPGAKPDASEWIVPVMARNIGASTKVESEKISPLLLDKKEKEFTLSTAGAAGSTLLNAGASGFYRVLYSQDALKDLMAKWSALTPEERLSLMSDVTVLSRKDLVPVEQSQDLLLQTKGEKDTIVLSNLVSKFAHLKPYMDATTKPQYEKFVRAYLQPLKTEYGWEEKKGEPETVKDLRADLIRILGTCGQDKETIKEALELYNKYMKDKESVSPDIISTVLTIVAYNGNEADYEQIRAAAKKAANPQEEKRFLMALTDFRQPELVAKTLDLTLHADTRATDSVALLGALLSNKDVNTQAWKFTTANWNKLSKKFPPRFNKRIAANCSNFNTAEMEEAMRTYFATQPMEMAQAAISRAIEEVHVSVLYKQRNEERLRKWVQKQAAELKDS